MSAFPAYSITSSFTQLSMQLLPGVLVGVVLGGLFSATMSTADSQVLSCSASIAHDIFPTKKSDHYLLSRAATVERCCAPMPPKA